jgi:anaerobic ribonucleoside-triphosphate reductase activating protein
MQGCSIKCPSCFNPELWGQRGGIEYSPAELAAAVAKMVEFDSTIEGVTFLGGEPFDQPDELGQAAALIRSLGLSVMTFTGFYLRDLQALENPGVARFLQETDLLVDGPYIESLLDTSRPWLGSTNQNFHFLSNRYSQKDVEYRDSIEVTVKRDGLVTLNGWASTTDIDGLLESLTIEDEFTKKRVGKIRG